MDSWSLWLVSWRMSAVGEPSAKIYSDVRVAMEGGEKTVRAKKGGKIF